MALQGRALGFKISDSDPGKAHVNIPHHPKRVVEAPAVQLVQPKRVLSVDLATDEDVEWVWSHAWDGSYASGHHIVKAAQNE